VPAGYQAVTCRITVESPDGEAAVRHVVETAAAHNPRLYDLSHAVPVTRELTVKRPARINGVAGVVNGTATHGSEGVTFRPARPEDCGAIAELFLIASDGLAAYIWGQVAEDGESPLETGRRRYAREGAAFSYQNCLVAEDNGRVIAMLHCFPMPPRNKAEEKSANDNTDVGGEPVDPVLQPYAELEDPGSLYVSGVAVRPEHRGRGIGRQLMERARARAESLGLSRASLICFEANQVALQLYRRLGYVEVDRRAIVPHTSLHYSEGDALLLVRGLD
jgi:ribosomal protein S18 acetylase RimI-like enzyme